MANSTGTTRKHTLTGTNGKDTIVALDEGDIVASGNATLGPDDADRDGDLVVIANAGSQNGVYGTFSLASSGDWTYVLDDSRPATDALAEGQIVTDTFMATYLWSSMVNQGFYSFNPSADFLFFDDPSISASLISVTVGGHTSISYGGKTVTLSTSTSTLTSSHISFQDGSKLIIGDDIVGTAGDSAGNVLSGTNSNDQLIGLGGNDTAVYLGGSAGYTFSVDSGRIVVTDTDSINGSDGRDVLVGVESVILGNEIVKIGSIGEFLVNTYTSDFQFEHAAAALTDGGFVVTWTSIGQDGSGGGIFAQRIGVDGVAIGGEFLVNSATPVAQFLPAAAGLPGGGFVIAWVSASQDGSDFGIYAQRYDGAGIALGDEFLINSSTFGTQTDPAIAGLSDGGFVVTWTTTPGFGFSDIHAQRFDSSGTSIGGESLVNTTTIGHQNSPSIVATNDGGFIVAWVSGDVFLGSAGLFVQRFDATGAPTGGEFQGNTTSYARDTPAIAVLEDGGFVIVWTTATSVGNSTYDVFAQRYASIGVAVGDAFQVNTYTDNAQIAPSVAALSDGGFVVAWQSVNQDSSHRGIFAQRFSASGEKVADEFRVNSANEFGQSEAAVTGLPDGGFVITRKYNQPPSTGNEYDIVSQRFDASGNPISAQLTGDDQDNVIHWVGPGNVIFDGGAGDDTLIGGSGNDTYLYDGQDTIIEELNNGIDLVRGGFSYTLGDNIENLTLTGVGNISGTGNNLDNVITGNFGHNQLLGLAGNDSLVGSTGADTMRGGAGNDTYDVDSASDVVIEAPNKGTDTVQSSIAYTLISHFENLILKGTADINGTGNNVNNIIMGNDGANLLSGASKDDSLSGGAGNDTLNGGTGGDSMTGGAGNDTYVVDAKGDVIAEGNNQGIDAVNSSIAYVLPVNVENLTLTGTSNINGTGNSADNIITGNSGNNLLAGGGGSDSLSGGGGNDVLVWDSIDYGLDGGSGTDTLQIDGAGQTIDLATIVDTVIRNIEILEITGSGNNTAILSVTDVLNISSTTDTLKIDGNAGDVVHMGTGWTDLGVNGGYHRYSQNMATLIIDKDITQGV